MQPNIVFLDEYSLGDADLGSIRALGNYTGYRTTAREEVADRCREADVVITNKVVFRRETLRQLPRLRLICVAATGMNHIDLEAAAELGIAVKNAVGYSTHAVTETTIGAAIGLGAGRVSTALGIVLGILAAAVGAVICALWFRRRVSRPVEQITEVTRTIAGGRYGTELPVQRDDELGRLATAINELSQEISRSEKMQSEFISSISHELRTPLTAITGWSETLMFDTAIQGDSRRGIAIISKEAARLTSLVEELLEFTRIQDGRFNLSMELLDIESELEDTIFTYQELLRQDGMQLIYNPPEEEIPLVPGDPERLKQVFLNILDNAAKYARDGKTIEVSVFSDSEAATIQFRDHGPGIPENELPHVKEKFFKGEKHKARGSGIGLAVCDEIITRSGGTLTIANAPGGGTLVSVRLPFAPESGN